MTRKIEDKLFLDKVKVDSEPHIKIKDPATCLKCRHKQCTFICPANVYKWDDQARKIVVGWENCLEMGACLVACNQFDNIDWRYPKGGYGISYRFG